VEAFARDLLSLIRAVRVYPADHPFLGGLANRLASQVGNELPSALTLGITPRELALGDSFVGAKHRRAAELAALLHGRRLLRLTWHADAGPAEVIAAAGVLAEPRFRGEELQAELARRVRSIEVEPLSLGRIHDAFQEGAREGPPQDEGRAGWLWLLTERLPPREAAEILASDRFWTSLTTDTGGISAEEAKDLTSLLAQMGDRLAAALDCLPPDRRGAVESRLAQVGRAVAPRELASILRAADAAGVLRGPLADALEHTFSSEKLVDLLANLVAQEGRGTRRLAEVYGRFAGGVPPKELVAAVQSRLATPDRGGFAAEIWGTVEEFLLSLQEDPFMGSDYFSSLEAFASGEETAGHPPPELDLGQNAEEDLDGVLAGLAIHDPGGWGQTFLEWLEPRLEGARIPAMLALVGEAAPRETLGESRVVQIALAAQPLERALDLVGRVTARLERATSLEELARAARRIGYVRPDEHLFIVKGTAAWSRKHSG
jgi:hypothetical protein